MIAFYISIVCRQQIIDNNMAARFPSHKFSNITVYSVQTYIYKPRQKNSLDINSLLFQSVHTCIYILTKTKHFLEINSFMSYSIHTYIHYYFSQYIHTHQRGLTLREEDLLENSLNRAVSCPLVSPSKMGDSGSPSRQTPQPRDAPHSTMLRPRLCSGICCVMSAMHLISFFFVTLMSQFFCYQQNQHN